jgi:hypothetical protein
MNHTHLLSPFCLKIGYIWKATYLSKANICMFRASKMLTTFCISSRTLSLSLVFHIFPSTVKCTSPAMLVKAWQVNSAFEHRVCRVSKNISWYNSYHILSIETPLIWYDTQLNKGIDKNAWHNCMIWKNYCWSSINYFWIYQPGPNTQCTFLKFSYHLCPRIKSFLMLSYQPLDIGTKIVFQLVWGKYAPSSEICTKVILSKAGLIP